MDDGYRGITADELRAEYAAGGRSFRRVRLPYGADLSGAYLRGADLREADLSGADLSGAYLREANLRGADLSEADLSGAYPREANLRGADLREADLRGAYLSEADLSGADLSGADLSGAATVVHGLTWTVTVYHDEMTIGCQSHPHSAWRGAAPEWIAAMHPHASAFWAAHGPMLLSLCDKVAADRAEWDAANPALAAKRDAWATAGESAQAEAVSR